MASGAAGGEVDVRFVLPSFPATDAVAVRAQVDRCLREIWQVDRVVVDGDGDVAFRAGTAACWVRVDACEPRLVRVFGHAVVGVRRTAALLRELNDVGSKARTTSVVWDEDGPGARTGVVRVSAVVHPDALGPRALQHAISTVAVVASDLGPMLAAVYGGSTPYDVVVEGD